MDTYKETTNNLDQVDKFIEQGEMDQARYELHQLKNKVKLFENNPDYKDWIDVVLDAIQTRTDKIKSSI